jgi:hypothetical protein
MMRTPGKIPDQHICGSHYYPGHNNIILSAKYPCTVQVLGAAEVVSPIMTQCIFLSRIPDWI